jgi:signal transduction histidine kinase/DNA-binding response OmpR family regulator
MKSKILYIDDEIENLESFNMTFWKFYDIRLALSTPEAESFMHQEEFELVISDQKMVDETGLEFIKRIKKDFPHTLFILLTAYSDMDVVIEAINIGLERYIQKPWDYNELKHAIDNAIDKVHLRKKNYELLEALQESNFQLKDSNDKLSRHAEELSEKQLELNKRERLLSAIYKNLPLVVLIIDANCRIIKINRTGKLVSGKKEKELVGKNCGEALDCVYSSSNAKGCGLHESCTNCVIKKTTQDSLTLKRDFYKIEGQLKLKTNGTIKPMTVSVSTTYFEFEEPMLILSLEDITRQKESEKKLQMQIAKTEALNEKLAEAIIKSSESERFKTAILANISHEIRTPLNGILGFTEMLLKPNLSEKKKDIFFNVIRDSSNRLLRVVDDLLEISSIETDKIEVVKEEVCLNKVITELLFKYTQKASKSGIDLLIYTPLSDDDSTIVSDRLRLAQIVDNLIGNALKFTSFGSVKFGYKTNGDVVKFFVKDTGIGISPQMHEKIFDGFFQVEMESTRMFSGIGVGLSISKKLVELLGGKIWLESAPKKGTTFYFTIPYTKIENLSYEKHDSLY